MKKSIEADLVNFLDNPKEASDFARNFKLAFKTVRNTGKIIIAD